MSYQMRCAECDCENGGADCNWIGVGEPAVLTLTQPLEERLCGVSARDAAQALLDNSQAVHDAIGRGFNSDHFQEQATATIFRVLRKLAE